MPSPDFNTPATAVPQPTIPSGLKRGEAEPTWIWELTENRTYGEMLQHRQTTAAATTTEEGGYFCPQCREPLTLNVKSPHYRFFFKHAKQGGTCSLETDKGEDRMSESEQRMEAVRESPLHVAMKNDIARQLSADERFTDVAVESRVLGTDLQNGKWRRPDVSAIFDGVRIAFEAQLSTTPLKDMQARRRFYASEGVCLVWVMPNFDTETRVVNLDDSIVQQDFAALSMTADTIAQSLSSERFMLIAHRWQEVKGCWIEALADFKDITLLPKEGRVSYPVDYEGEEGSKSDLAYQLAQINDYDPTPEQMEVWDEFRVRVRRSGVAKFRGMPSVPLLAFIRAVLLATTGEEIGWKISDLHDAAAQLFEKDWSALMTFLGLLESRSMALDESVNEPMGVKADLALLRSEWPNGPKSFHRSSTDDIAAITWLFPEIEIVFRSKSMDD